MKTSVQGGGDVSIVPQENAQTLEQFSQGLLSMMLAILIIGIVMDSLFFGRLDRAVRRRWGLGGPA
jgi:hypothetical protein